MRGAGIILKRWVHLLIYKEECLEGSADESDEKAGRRSGFLIDSRAQTSTLHIGSTWEGRMNLVTVRISMLSGMIAAAAALPFLSVVSNALIFGAVIVVLWWLGRYSDTEKEELKPDLVRIALVWKMVGSADAFAGVFAWSVGIFVFLVEVLHGRLLPDPIWAFFFSALCGFYVRSAFYLLFQWTDDLRRLEDWNEIGLVNAVQREKNVVRKFNPMTLPFCIVTGYRPGHFI